MKSCDKKLRNRKNLKLFLAGSAMLLLASCSSAPAVLNGNPIQVQDEVVRKVQPKSSVVYDEAGSVYVLVVPFGSYAEQNSGDMINLNYTSTSFISSWEVYDTSNDDEIKDSSYWGLSADDTSYHFGINVDPSSLDDGIRLYLDTTYGEFLFDFYAEVYESSYFTVLEPDGAWQEYRNFNDYEPAPLGVTFVQDIVEILVSGITSLGSALGQGISTTAQAMFINASNDGLSVWGILVASFAGLALAVGLTRLVFGFITSLGGKN